MSDRKIYILSTAEARSAAVRSVECAPDGWIIQMDAPKRKDVQNSKMHAMIADIARQVVHVGRKWSREDMKRLLVDDFRMEMQASGTPLSGDGEIVPSLDGRRIVQLGLQTRNFSQKEASAFIEFLTAFGIERNVKWTWNEK